MSWKTGPGNETDLEESRIKTGSHILGAKALVDLAHWFSTRQARAGRSMESSEGRAKRLDFWEWRAFADRPWTGSVDEFEPLIPLDD